MGTNSKHTPLEIGTTSNLQDRFEATLNDGKDLNIFIIHPLKQKADNTATRLAHCWNCHDELVAAFEKIEAECKAKLYLGADRKLTEVELKNLIGAIGQTAESALKKAKGE